MKSTFPAAIDGDLLKLMYLSNDFRMVDVRNLWLLGMFVRPRLASFRSSMRTKEKIVKIKGFIYCQGQRVIEDVSSFLYRGRFSDYENTFDTIKEPDYVVSFQSDADVGVLQSKEWFEWENESSPLLTGMSLICRIQSQVSFKDRTVYCNVSVSGNIFFKNQLKVSMRH